MANNQVEIDVVLNAEQAEKGFNKLEEGSKVVGESFSSVGKAVSTLGGEANKALGGVGESLSGVVDGFGNLAKAAKSGGASFTALAGPVGIAVVAVMELVQAFKEYASEASGASLKIEAYRASASELTSIIEELSDAQIKLNKADIEAFRIQSQRAQALTEEGQLLNEKGSSLRAEIQIQQDAIRVLEQKTRSEKTYYLQKFYYESIIAAKRREVSKLEAKLKPITQKADNLAIKGAKERAKLTEMREAKLKESPENVKKRAEQEAKILNQARINELQATKNDVKTQIEIAKIGSQQKQRDLNAIEDLSEKTRSKARAAERKRLEAEIASIEKAFADKRRAKSRQYSLKRQANRAKEAAMELAKARQLQTELKNIRALELQAMELQGASALDLAKERYKDELKAAGDNQNLKLIAEMKYQNILARLENERTQKIQDDLNARVKAEEDSLKRRFENAKSFAFETAEFDARQIEDQTQRELALLDLRYQKEISLNEHTQEEITELQRRHSIERQKIEDQTINAQMQKFTEFTKEFGSGLAQATYNSLLFGEGFKESIGNVLIGIGQQASVEAIMELARGFSKLGSPLTAGLAPAHFKASALFAGAATAAGVAGKALGGGGSSAGGGGGGGAGPVSPSGTPQTTGAPQREQAETSSMVFNINFGGAVIYDTQRAAEQALADRITNLQNTRRRGAPRRGAM